MEGIIGFWRNEFTAIVALGGKKAQAMYSKQFQLTVTLSHVYIVTFAKTHS